MLFHGESNEDKFGLSNTDHIHELMVLMVVFLMLLGCFAKVVFL